jgi:hypothetical protein
MNQCMHMRVKSFFLYNICNCWTTSRHKHFLKTSILKDISHVYVRTRRVDGKIRNELVCIRSPSNVLGFRVF